METSTKSKRSAPSHPVPATGGKPPTDSRPCSESARVRRRRRSRRHGPPLPPHLQRPRRRNGHVFGRAFGIPLRIRQARRRRRVLLRHGHTLQDPRRRRRRQPGARGRHRGRARDGESLFSPKRVCRPFVPLGPAIGRRMVID